MHTAITEKNTHRPRLSGLLVFAAVLWGFATGAAYGQVSDRVQAQLERTDQVLENAEQAVVESGSPKGEALLKTARRLQQQAWDFFYKKQIRQAEQKTQRAREKALEIIAATRSPEENENAVRRQLERTDELIRILDERIGRVSPGRRRAPTARLEFWHQQQQRAWQQFYGRRLRVALKLSLGVRERLTQLAEAARGHRYGRSPEAVEPGLERLREYLERVRGPIIDSGLENKIDMLARAERRLAQAEEALAESQISIADEHAKICRELLDRAMAGIDHAVDPQTVTELITRAQEEWERLEGPVIDAGVSNLRQLHQQAKVELNRARAKLKNDQLTQALAHARTAVRHLDEIKENIP